MDRSVRTWAAEVAHADARILRVGYFGSYARGNWGVGSDVDIVVFLRETSEPFERRALAYDTGALPVPADLLVYTVSEWERMASEGGLPRTVGSDIVWVYSRPGAGSAS